MSILEEKKALRKKLRAERVDFSHNAEYRKGASVQIAEKLFQTDEYQNCSTILTFISTEIEVDTSRILERAFADGKIVAAPRCISEKNEMDFYVISSLEDLEHGAYGILEPKQTCAAADISAGALCIVPGLAFDLRGQRIGFGRGYYDRFLSGFKGVSCGVCFDEFLLENIPCENVDLPVDILFTQSKTLRFK